MSDSAAVLEAFRFIESAAAEFSDEDEEEESESKDRTILDLATVSLTSFPTMALHLCICAETQTGFCGRW